MFDEPIYAVRVERKQAVQTHPVPGKVTQPQGPFPSEMFAEPEIISVSEVQEFEPGATVQNNFKPEKTLRCARCLVRVKESETEGHICG
jgi:uncharacterized metal-binding protein YceD (DUF177 family)